MKRLACILLAVVLIPVGLLCILASTTVDTEPEDLVLKTIFALEDDALYRAETLVVLERFYFDIEEQTGYFLALMETADQEAVAVAFSAEMEDDVWPMLLSCSMEQPVTLDCYVEANDYYGSDRYLDPIHAIAMEAIATATDKQVPIMEDLWLEYYCDGSEDAAAQGAETARACVVMGLIFLGLAALAVMGLVRKKPSTDTVTFTTYGLPPHVRQQLEHYKPLVDAGLMTKEEYDQKREELLRK